MEDATSWAWTSVYSYAQDEALSSILYHHTATLVGKYVYVFGGRQSFRVHSQLYVLDLVRKEWSILDVRGDVPSPRSMHSAFLWYDRLYIFGGYDGGMSFNDLFVLDLALSEWYLLEQYGNIPDPCFGHTTEIVSSRNEIVLYGGNKGYVEKLNSSLYGLNADECTWNKLCAKGHAPSPRYKHAACSTDNFMFIYGGRDRNKQTNDFYVLTCSPVHIYWSQPVGPACLPSVRVLCSLTYIQGKLLLFGGNSMYRTSNEVHVYEISCNTWYRAQPMEDLEDYQKAGTKYSVVGMQLAQQNHVALYGSNKLIIIGGLKQPVKTHYELIPVPAEKESLYS